ncbi:hypothetical protein HOG21_02900 [bacterium]|jgi:hypothetical protein|nr:hypothetical protein [bacterium]
MLNKNIIQLTLFILLIILASILLNYLYYLIIPDEESNSLKEIKKYHKDNSIDILFLGDSHPKFAVNPKFIDNKNVYNFSIATINYISIYHNLEILLNKENIKVQNIIIEIDPHNFSEKKFQVTPLKNYKFYSKYYSQNYISKINNENIYTTFKKSIIQSYF